MEEKKVLADGLYFMTVKDGKPVSCSKKDLEKTIAIKINWFKFIKALILKKPNRYWLLKCLEYAICKGEEVRGWGAADVLAFEKVYFKDSIERTENETD